MSVDTMSDLPENFVVPLSDFGIIQLRGADADSYLQGQTTNDLNDLLHNTSQIGAHCDFKGKVWSVFRAIRYNDALLLLTHKNSIDKSLAELRKYAVFSAVEIDDVSSLFDVVGMPANARTKNLLNTQFGSSPLNDGDVVSHDSGIIVKQCSPVERFLVLSLAAQSNDWINEENTLPASIWEAWDIQAGLPQVTGDTVNEFVPQMMNLQALHGISFTKGCYMGQEVVARTKYLGKNKRAAAILRCPHAHNIDSGELLEIQIGDNWRRGGTILRTSTLSKETWVLAVVPNDTEEDTVFRLKSDPKSYFSVYPLPYSLDDEN